MDKKAFVACIVLVGLFIISIIGTNKAHDELKKKGVIVEALFNLLAITFKITLK